ncbi:hypothetical protein [Roseospira visakhapatnamensis]|uniref:Alpha/beta hydrolase n=1 Tax=Roseospira visakhapatnamensis TaxID=390880 RepID=A0A7W6WAA4_9PROT|nr:hypothetical protein [Roseospira visakhapatnamensis]MBB4266267.1 hypothetical protein [Roseospira visakhapatnamensis]
MILYPIEFRFPWMNALAPRGEWLLGASLRSRNTVLDMALYNVGDLTDAEIETLTRATNREGRVLIVYPSGWKSEDGIVLLDDHAAVRDRPGPLLEHFCIAGVGSSDLGAAALARDVANAVRAPVGAIVAGYGMMDVVTEGLGGWTYLRARNRLLDLVDDDLDDRAKRRDDAPDTADEASGGPHADGDAGDDTGDDTGDTSLVDTAWATPDVETLRRFFLDADRDIKMVVGHSKGCLSIADAMVRLARDPDPAVHDRIGRVRIITTGAVVRFPSVCANVTQYLGELDILGACNSRGNLPRVLVPNANHHLNTWVPYHLSMAQVLRHAETGGTHWVAETP